MTSAKQDGWETSEGSTMFGTEFFWKAFDGTIPFFVGTTGDEAHKNMFHTKPSSDMNTHWGKLKCPKPFYLKKLTWYKRTQWEKENALNPNVLVQGSNDNNSWMDIQKIDLMQSNEKGIGTYEIDCKEKYLWFKLCTWKLDNGPYHCLIASEIDLLFID